MHSEAEKHLRQVDPRLGAIIDRVGPCTLKPRRRSPYQALVSAVVYQQLNGNAAETILKRFIALYPGKRFPAAADVLATPDEKLRSAGLSGAKARAIRDIAEKTAAGFVPAPRQIHGMTDDEILTRLVELRGVGPWTVEMLLIFTLGRMDVLPTTDYGVRQGVAKVYRLKELPHPKDLLKRGESWRPYRSIASWYFWRALELK